MANKDIRKAARIAGVPMWRIAIVLGISEPTIFRWLRVELPEDKKAAVLAAIERLSREDVHENADN